MYIAFKTLYYNIEFLSTGLKSFKKGLGGSLIEPVNGSTNAPIYKEGLFLEIAPKCGLNPNALAPFNRASRSGSKLYFIPIAVLYVPVKKFNCP